MTRLMRFCFLALAFCSLGLLAFSQSAAQQDEKRQDEKQRDEKQQPPKLDGRDGRDLLLREFHPKSMLKVAEHHLHRSKFPSVDVHTHPLARLQGSAEALAEFVSAMDQNNIAVCVSLDGRMRDELTDHLAYLKPFTERFVVFANIDWRGKNAIENQPSTWAVNQASFAHETVEALRDAKRQGAAGLKIFKEFGLTIKNGDGSLLAIDDPRLNPIWEECARLQMPVLIHTADPAAFFEPVDQYNERWAELQNYPDWSFADKSKFPRREELLAARNRVIAAHRNTIFIGAHVANNSEDLATVGEWLDTYPNLYADIAARISELGRQPYTARDFFEKYQDRILFGTDGPRASRLTYYWRFLETRDEYFPYADLPVPPKGYWQIYGIHLEDAVLKKIYFQNACRVVPGIQEKYDAWVAAHPQQ